jgi:hypothetical protein
MGLTKNTSQGEEYFDIGDETTRIEQVVRAMRFRFPDNLSLAITSCAPSRANGNMTGKMVVKVTHLGDADQAIDQRDVQDALDSCANVHEDAMLGRLDQLVLFDPDTGLLIEHGAKAEPVERVVGA